MHRISLIVICSLAALVLGYQAMSQSPAAQKDPMLTQILEQLRVMQAQIDRLESRLAAVESGAAAERLTLARPTGAGMPQRIMQMTGIETVKPGAVDMSKVEELEQEADILQRTVDSYKEQIASLAGSGYSGAEARDTSRSQRRAALAKLLADYQHQARMKKGEAARMRKEMLEPRQVITGTLAGKKFTLKTEGDEACKLAQIAHGSYVTWDGSRESSSDSEEVWLITSIDAVDMEVFAPVAAAKEQ